nr:MAG TPA: hypothetical protein [Caudoviricetes sp.]
MLFLLPDLLLKAVKILLINILLISYPNPQQ